MTGRATTSLLEKLRREWDECARAARPDADYFRSGDRDVARDIVPRLTGARSRALEIGCGAGRMTRALARLFETVYAVDISAAMVSLAPTALAGYRNVRVLQIDGRLLDAAGHGLDLAVAYGVFPHLPREWVVSYVREVGARLRPGGAFLFEVAAEFEIEPILRACGYESLERETDGRPYDLVWSVRPLESSGR